MAKFYGLIGYIEEVETKPGIWRPKCTELPYSGDFIHNTSKFQISSGGTNDNVTTANEISIVADPYACNHFSSIRYVEYGGVKWKVDAVKVKHPKLILTIGGVYNGEQATTAE